jgi:hypothetical protein
VDGPGRGARRGLAEGRGGCFFGREYALPPGDAAGARRRVAAHGARREGRCLRTHRGGQVLAHRRALSAAPPPPTVPPSADVASRCVETGALQPHHAVVWPRLVELEAGVIKVDGYDIAALGLRTLRARLAIVPQDPVLYSGSFRFNLDPFNEYRRGRPQSRHQCMVFEDDSLVPCARAAGGGEARGRSGAAQPGVRRSRLSVGAARGRSDEEVWAAVDTVNMRDKVGSLDAKVAESGSNMSVGERQLLCMSRALLKKARIVVRAAPISRGIISHEKTNSWRNVVTSCCISSGAGRGHSGGRHGNRRSHPERAPRAVRRPYGRPPRRGICSHSHVLDARAPSGLAPGGAVTRYVCAAGDHRRAPPQHHHGLRQGAAHPLSGLCLSACLVFE